jgi:ADP-heptose:LPS heptosyltransferase
VSESNDFEENQAEMDAFFRSMAQERFDLALQMQGGGAFSNPFVRRLGARVTAGLQSGNAVPLDRNVPYIYFQPEIMRSLEVVALVGAYPAGLEPCFPITDEDVRESLSAVARVENLVALHPGVGHPGRQWPAVRFAATGDALAREGATVIVVGGAGEKDLGACVVEHMEAASVNAAGRLSLGGLAGLFSRCRVVVSNDSGPLHLACAVGAATVGIYWCFNLYTAGPLTRTRHRPVVSWRIRCPVCDRDQTQDPCVHRASYVADIPVEHVVQAALDLLRQEGTRYRRRVERGFW